MLGATDPEGYVACCAAVSDMDQRDAISAIRVPALVITGRYDAVTPLAHGRLIADRVPGAELVEFDAAHLANIENLTAFTPALPGFLDRQKGAPLSLR